MIRAVLISTSRALLVIGLLVGAYSIYDSYTAIQHNESEGFFLQPPENPKYSGIVRLLTPSYSFICTGVIISRHYALTAAHCVVDSFNKIQTSKKYNIQPSDRSETIGDIAVVSVDLYRDVALLRGNFDLFAPLMIDWSGILTTAIQDMRAVSSCGFPSGGDFFCSALWYAGNYNFQMLFTGGPIYKGMSGGPVLAKHGDGFVVIGINSAVTHNGVVIGPVVGAKETLWAY